MDADLREPTDAELIAHASTMPFRDVIRCILLLPWNCTLFIVDGGFKLGIKQSWLYRKGRP